MFPVFGSIALFSLYVLFKVFEKEYINYLLSIYFAGAGTFAMARTFSQLIIPFLKVKMDTYSIVLQKNSKSKHSSPKPSDLTSHEIFF
jgi:minor histocompatibility antigen H13